PPGAARVYSVDNHTLTGLTPPAKYDPAGDAISVYTYSAAGAFTPSPTDVEIMNGRRYSDASPSEGTHLRSALASSRNDPRNSSSGSAGMAIRRAEVRNRSAFASGRKAAIVPSGCW